MEKHERKWLILGIISVAVVALAMAALFFRLAATPTLPAPAQAVQDLLELRRNRSTDASAYAQYFESVDVANSLAQDASATAETTAATRPSIPEWEPPYLSAQASNTADVVVVWVSDRRFKEWAKATVFNTKRMSGLWKIVDAQEMTSTPPPELGSSEATKAP